MTDIAQEVLNRFDTLAAKLMEVSPVVWDKLAAATQAAAIIDASKATAAFLLFSGLCYALVKYCIRSYNNNPDIEFDTVLSGGFAIVFLVCTFVALLLVIDADWLAVFSPESRLILDTVQAVK